jgi:hypothetical protein
MEKKQAKKVVVAPAKEHKFGSKEFFIDYVGNQIKKENNVQQTVARCHFALSSLIIETHKGKEAFTFMKNLTEACEQLSEWKKSVSYID